MELEGKLKVALDESRLLILGAQVLFGVQFEGAFQERFKYVSSAGQTVQCVALLLLLVSICLLIAPSLHHQIIYAGESRKGALASATGFAGASLLPLTLGLGASVFVVTEYLFGRRAGIAFGAAFTAIGLSLLYGLGFALKRQRRVKEMPERENATPLKTKIEQVLTEARVIIPGAQALLGFQFIAILTNSFHELPAVMRYVHVAALCAVAIAAMLLMKPAAVHRIAFQGENDEAFFRIGSCLIIAATCPLALGIAADVAVVFYIVTRDASVALGAGVAALCLLLGVWLIYPMWRRTHRRLQRSLAAK